ncbi:MAG: GtrA family protein [Burkholderiales bacterium]|nr:GtrA family protein [Burkholderiales bacterium]
MKQAARIALLYAVVSAIATAANIGCQALVIWAYQGPHAVPLSVLAGTATGLPIKYVLEKRHIFGFEAESLAHDGRLFFVYTFFGVFTTALFWGIEFAFHLAFGTDAMRYLGGAIGLTVGAIVKYQLDKRYVFTRRLPAGAM